MDHIADHESVGCRRMDRSLGFVKMPRNYALMLIPDGDQFYWLRATDGQESETHWNKWAVYRGAVVDAGRAALVGGTHV